MENRPDAPANLEVIIDDFARKQRRQARPVPVSKAVARLKALVPDSTYNDSELATLVAERLIAFGLDVDFDAGGEGMMQGSPAEEATMTEPR